MNACDMFNHCKFHQRDNDPIAICPQCTGPVTYASLDDFSWEYRCPYHGRVNPMHRPPTAACPFAAELHS
jgi:hypothetical protein